MPSKRSGSLRAVQPDEQKPAGRRPRSTVSTAAAGGDRRELLVAARARVAKAVDDAQTPPRDLASLTRRLLEIAKEIELIDARALDEEDSGDDSDGGADEAWDESAI